MSDLDKIHERVLEIQKNLEKPTTNQLPLMLSELLEIASQIEQSLSEVKLNINEIKNEE